MYTSLRFLTILFALVACLGQALGSPRPHVHGDHNDDNDNNNDNGGNRNNVDRGNNDDNSNTANVDCEKNGDGNNIANTDQPDATQASVAAAPAAETSIVTIVSTMVETQVQMMTMTEMQTVTVTAAQACDSSIVTPAPSDSSASAATTPAAAAAANPGDSQAARIFTTMDPNLQPGLTSLPVAVASGLGLADSVGPGQSGTESPSMDTAMMTVTVSSTITEPAAGATTSPTSLALGLSSIPVR